MQNQNVKSPLWEQLDLGKLAVVVGIWIRWGNQAIGTKYGTTTKGDTTFTLRLKPQQE